MLSSRDQTPLASDTISETSSNNADLAASKKRKRSESESRGLSVDLSRASPMDTMSIKSLIPGEVARKDDKYYFEDGSCMLLVEDTLFNVHRTMLARDNSFFANMFEHPQGDEPADGRNEDSPITLNGDSVSEIRNFLWALYALPPELQVISSQDADLTQMMDICRISNKYSFRSLETWVLNAIQEYVNRSPSPILNTVPHPKSYSFSAEGTTTTASSKSSQSTAQLTRLIRLAQMCHHEKLLTTMIGIMKQLMSSSLQYAYLAMTLADELDIRALRGPAYLEVLQKAPVVKACKADNLPKKMKRTVSTSQIPGVISPTSSSSERSAGDVDSEGVFIVNCSQQVRLLSGYYRLTKTWERLRATPPQFDHSTSCSATWHQHGCSQSWLEFWKEKTRSDAVLANGMADVLGRLRQVQKEYDRWGTATYMHHDCRLLAKSCIADVLRQIENALPDYFSDGDD